MDWETVAYTCETGPCPTLDEHKETEAVRVQAARVPPHRPIPDFEVMSEIQKPDWHNLIRQYLERHPEFVREFLEQHPQ